jgi:hypothetical protein
MLPSNFTQCEEAVVDYDEERHYHHDRFLVNGRPYDALIDLTRNGVTVKHCYLSKFHINLYPKGRPGPGYSRPLYTRGPRGDLTIDLLTRGFYNFRFLHVGCLNKFENAVFDAIERNLPWAECVRYYVDSILVVFDDPVSDEAEKVIDYFSRQTWTDYRANRPYMVSFLRQTCPDMFPS